jgi:hypothetical protein
MKAIGEKIDYGVMEYYIINNLKFYKNLIIIIHGMKLMNIG